ncbi:MAG TPA: NrfD/PsrC family molybdoenzyme membrane anchor subunit [Tepidisphaeraceae bacterium]|nr:NrfD/PsrC family molybdoenzyme membrane anchor subunit [Tepidisphaeraceae bacterium]
MAEDNKDVPYSAPWAENLKHRPDPNRVRSIQTLPQSDIVPPTEAARVVPPVPGTLHLGRAPAPSAETEPSYYNISPLKQPVWKWEIAAYFFLGGLSAGAHLLGRVAERAGRGRHEDLSRAAAYIALAAILPSPPLLIADLGDPKRFHHMLRVWKPSSPMNFGTWAITTYGGVAAAEAIRQYLKQSGRRLAPAERSKLQKLLDNSTLLILHDAVGIPAAICVAGYTGVLLSCTSNPLWCKNPYLGPLFSASALATAAESVGLALECTAGRSDEESPSLSALRKVDSLAHLAELLLMRGFNRFAGEKAEPLHAGTMAKHHKFSVRAILAAELLKLFPVPGFLRRPKRLLVNLLGLSAGWAMRWAFIYGGHEAAANPHIARLVSRPPTPKA